jgi:hypothetical protein
VQFELRRDIQALETRIRAINIGAIPAAIGVFAIGLGLWRLRRRRAGVARAAAG